VKSLLLLAALAGGGDSDVLIVDNFACVDQEGVFQRLSRHADAELVVLYSFTNDCPIVRQNASELQALADEYEPRGVRFLGLDAAPQDDRPAIALEARELGLRLPILRDETQCVAEMLRLERSGEALVISTKDWALRWRGPLDDRLGYGAQKPEARRGYLRETLDALLAHQPPPEDTPGAKGCKITYVRPRETDEADYARDVAPILLARCVPCHREGGIGPWAMNGYKRVHGFSAMIRDVVLQRRMTPWHLDPLYGDFRNELWLRPDEHRTLVHWIERGAPRGEGADPLERTVEPLPEWPLGEPDLVIELPEQKLPATGLIRYRYHTVQLDLPTERWVRAVDLHSSNAQVLHHAFAFIEGQQEAMVLQEMLSRASPERRARVEQWLAEHGASPENPPKRVREKLRKIAFQGTYTFFAKYVPGEGVDPFPEDAGKLLPANPTLTFQLHYSSIGTETTDRPRLGIYFRDTKPKHELKVTTALEVGFEIPPGERAFPISGERLFEKPVRLYAMSPHMHYRGRSMRYTAYFPDGTSEVLMSLPEYVFDWQTTYTLREPRLLPAGTRVVCDGVFDNSATNEYNPNPKALVRFGPRTLDEMFGGYMLYSEE